jgi:hypothetical protein
MRLARGSIAVLLVLAGAAHADALQLSVDAPSAASASHASPHLGLMAGIGVPDGATAALAWRPVRALRVEAGVAHNYISPGLRAGLTYIPFRSWATPTLGIGYGHFFERNANPAVRQISGDASFDSPLLDRVGYDYEDARVGLELGRKHVTFFLHAGITRVTARIHDLAAAANANTSGDGGSMVTVTSSDPKVTVWGPSVDLGVIVYLF